MDRRLPLTGLITALAVIFIVVLSISAVAVLRAIPAAGTPDQDNSAPAWAAEVESRVRNADPALGAVVYSQYGCETCHGAPTGVGPYVVGIGQRAATRRAPAYSAAAYLYESIIDPNAYIVPGYSPNLMPQNFKVVIPEGQLDALVAWLLTQ
jgi:cytochrome c551/c552